VTGASRADRCRSGAAHNSIIVSAHHDEWEGDGCATGESKFSVAPPLSPGPRV
jgi:hypothetical protein